MKKSHLLFGLLLGVISISACRETISEVKEVDIDDEVVVREPRPLGERMWCAADSAEVVNKQGQRNHDDNWALWSTRIPGGFAGMWIRNDTMRVGLRDLQSGPAAVDAVLELSGRRATPVQVRYDWLELYGCYRVANQVAWRIPGMFSSDIQEVRNRLEYGVTSDSARQKLIAAVVAARIPRDMVEANIGSPPVLLSGSR
jgi:hypothetical protein